MQLTLDGKVVRLRFDSVDFGALNAVRQLPYRRFDAATNAWEIDYVVENFEAAQKSGLPLDTLPAPTERRSGIGTRGRMLTVNAPPTSDNIEACRKLPDQRTWNKTEQTWVVKPTRRNVAHLRAHFPDLNWSQPALDLVATTEAPFVQDKGHLNDLIERATRDFKFGTKPYQHQLAAFALGRDAVAFAYFMEQGTGKTKVTIDNAAFLHCRGDVNGVLVVCPKSVKSTWVEEIEMHLPEYIQREVLVWESGRVSESDVRKLSKDKLTFFVMNIDALSTGSGIGAATAFLARFDAMMAIDESSRIKTPSAKRTKEAIKLGKMAKYRRILTGTPVTQSPLDLFTQFMFLDPNILGFSSFYAFRNHYTVMGGWQNKQVLKYVNMSELQETITPYSYRVTKDECLDLPPKQYRRLEVELTPTQAKVYKELVTEMSSEIEGVGQISATLALTILLRLQQVIGGFFPILADDGMPVNDAGYRPIPGGNPKLDALMDDIEDLRKDQKVLIWARFRAEIDMVSSALREKYGPGAVGEFHGGVKEADRTLVRRAFQDRDNPLRFLVLQVDTGGVGLTFTASDTAYYFSNSFSLESRLQSEARNHRSGSEIHEHVTYTDIIARLPGGKKILDDKLHTVLRKKLSLANVITGDNWHEWI